MAMSRRFLPPAEIVTVPPKATVPPPDIPVPACTVMEGFGQQGVRHTGSAMLIVPLLLMGPPVRPAPVPTLVTVPPEAKLVSVNVPPNATVPPPDNPDPACTVMEGLASRLFVTPAARY